MKIQVGHIRETERNDPEEIQKGWTTILEGDDDQQLLERFCEWLNDADCEMVNGYSADCLTDQWFRIIR